jgi:hypothetical protein
MALSVAKTTFTITATSSADIDVTLGFQPKLGFVWMTGNDSATDEVERADIVCSRGFFDNNATPRQAVNAGWVDDDAGTAEAATAVRTDAVIMELATGATITGQLSVDDVTNWPGTGVRFNVDDAFVGTYKVHIWAIGGSDVTNTYVGSGTSPGATGTQDVTAPGFDTDAVLFHQTNLTNALPHLLSDMHGNLGFGCERSATQYDAVLGVYGDGGATTNTISYQRGGELGVTMHVSGGTFKRCSFNGTITGGFQLDWLEDTDTRQYIYAAIAGTCTFHVDSFTQSTLTVDDQIARTGYGGQPSAFLAQSRMNQQSGVDTANDHITWSLGGATSASQRACSTLVYPDAQATSVAGRAIDYDSILQEILWSPPTEQTATVDYTSVKDAGTPAWTNPTYIATDDANNTEWADADGWPSSALQIEVDDAPGDYNGSTINSVQFEIIWSLSATPSRDKSVQLNWRKSDTTLIHAWNTGDKSTSGEETQNEGGQQTPTGTSALTTSEWNGSYIEVITDEGGGKGDTVDVYIDYVKITVLYDDDTGAVTSGGILDVYSVDSDGITFVNDVALNQFTFVEVFAVMPAGAPPPTAVKMEAMRVIHDW